MVIEHVVGTGNNFWTMRRDARWWQISLLKPNQNNKIPFISEFVLSKLLYPTTFFFFFFPLFTFLFTTILYLVTFPTSPYEEQSWDSLCSMELSSSQILNTEFSYLSWVKQSKSWDGIKRKSDLKFSCNFEDFAPQWFLCYLFSQTF